jgi:transposase
LRNEHWIKEYIKSIIWVNFASAFQRSSSSAQQLGYRRPKTLPACFARLQADHPQASPGTVLICQDEASQLAELLLTGIQAKKKAQRALRSAFHQHPDHTIFSSLPGAVDLLAPALLAKFGDDRQRFPAPGGLQALVGTCPVTEKSGKHKRVKFCRACDRQYGAVSSASPDI